jgi:mRNA interferase MazF
MRRGEIRWYKFLPPDKKRPVVILTRNSALEFMQEVTIAPITTTIRNIPTEVFLSKSEGMPQECVVNCDHLQTVSKGKIGSLITSLPAPKLAEVGRAIHFALEI